MVPFVHENVHRFEVTVEHTADESMMASATSQAITHIGANDNGIALLCVTKKRSNIKSERKKRKMIIIIIIDAITKIVCFCQRDRVRGCKTWMVGAI